MISQLLSWMHIKDKPECETVQDITVAVAESVTAGALSNTLCAEPGASNYFKGGIVAYSVASKKDLLDVNTEYAERNNFANPFTTSEMAHSVVRKFKSRIGISTTGFSLPYYRPASKDVCELNILIPYAYICLYDSHANYEKIVHVTYKEETDKTEESKEENQEVTRKVQRARFQVMVAKEAKKLYCEYVNELVKQSKDT